MELKPKLSIHLILLKVLTFNRTFMELKLRVKSLRSIPNSAFNRTFMELKQRKIARNIISTNLF